MEDGRPDGRPAHEIRVDGRLIDRHDIVDSIVKQRDQPRNTHDSQRLRTKHTEDHRCQRRREERLVDAVEFACAAVHI